MAFTGILAAIYIPFLVLIALVACIEKEEGAE